jgi:hypothetical protein
MMMPTELTSFILVVLLSLTQVTPVQVKVEKHLLGETAEQFFSEGNEEVLLSACAAKDFGEIDKSIKKTAKEYCAWLSGVRKRAISGENVNYKDELSIDETKTTTYTFAGGKFVAAEIFFASPQLINNYHGKSFSDVFNGLKGTYGAPSSENILPYHNSYGVPFDRHQKLWLGDSYAIQLDEQPDAHGWTKVSVSTRELYDKQRAESVKPPPNPLN